MNRRSVLPLLLVLASGIVGAILYRSAGIPAPTIVREERTLMGTQWSIQIVLASNRDQALARVSLDKAFSELTRVESVMSEWRPSSPISRVNAAAGTGPVEVPEELVSLLRRAQEYGQMTDGAFDITWRGLGAIWSLGEEFEPPSAAEIAAGLKRVDYRRITITGHSVTVPEGFSIGLGGIAKGYAIDRAGLTLKEQGFRSFLINGGGDVLTSGGKAGKAWTIGVRDPRARREDLVSRVQVLSGAVVTSGDYERYKIVDGVRYHHIIDPRTGWPADRCRSVTIVADSAEEADVLATALFVLGPEEGLPLVAKLERVEAFLIDREGQYWMTDGFRSMAEIRGQRPLPWGR